MLKINLAQLKTATQDAPAFAPPKLEGGVDYLFNAVYARLLKGETAHLSDLDFDAFETEDIRSLGVVHEQVYEKNNYKAAEMAGTLRDIVPTTKAMAYV